MVISFGIETKSTYAYVDSSVPVLYDNLGIMIPYPEQSFSSAGLYTVFSKWVNYQFKVSWWYNFHLAVGIVMDLRRVFDFIGHWRTLEMLSIWNCSQGEDDIARSVTVHPLFDDWPRLATDEDLFIQYSQVNVFLSGGSTIQQSTKYRLLLATWLLSLVI